MSTIMVVDDDETIREIVRTALESAGFSVQEAADGRSALEHFDTTNIALLILDIVMGGLQGTDVCRTLRQSGVQTPIIFLSSRDDEIDRVIGLELGGDDYMTKPFSPRELIARVRAVLRRFQVQDAKTASVSTLALDDDIETRTMLKHGRLKLDLARFAATWGDKEITLTVTETGILRSIMAHPGQVFTREQLMNSIYNYNNIVSERTIDSHIRRVRRKFSAVDGDPIETIHGVGYRLGRC